MRLTQPPAVDVRVPPLSLRCPHCRNVGIFTIHATVGFHLRAEVISVPRAWTILRCPNYSCLGVVFGIVDSNELIVSYPPSTIEFNTEGIPKNILASFMEAINSHSNSCFRAAAIMVRRTLEEICADRGAQGRDLKARIGALRTRITVPQELLDAADELRLLGNDAAHLEAKIYDEVGQAEVTLALELCRELLKAVYQMASLVERLRALKRSDN